MPWYLLVVETTNQIHALGVARFVMRLLFIDHDIDVNSVFKIANLERDFFLLIMYHFSITLGAFFSEFFTEPFYEVFYYSFVVGYFQVIYMPYDSTLFVVDCLLCYTLIVLIQLKSPFLKCTQQ